MEPLSEVRLKAVMSYAKLLDQIGDSDKVEEITRLTHAAEIYLRNAGIEDTGDELYELALDSLVTHWHDNRDAISSGSVPETPFGLRPIINQLKFCALTSVPESGTED